MRQLFRQIGKRGSEIVDEIGKFFHQVVGKRGPRLQGGKLLSFFLPQGFSDERNRSGFPFCHSFGSGDGVERLHGLLENRVQLFQLLLHQSKPPLHIVCHLAPFFRNETDLAADRPLANVAASVIASTRLPGSAMPFPTISNAVP